MDQAALLALVAAAALHLGFQLTVTVLVYPALVRVEPTRWAQAHGRHSRAITPLVALAYGALLLAGGWALIATWPHPWVMVAAGGGALSMLATASVAAPTHGRLAAGPSPVLLRRLLRADRVRLAGAVTALAGAAVAASGSLS